MNATRLSPSRRREDILAWWAEHLQVQRDCGQTQVAYCRARGLDPKYFTLWKRKLRDERAAAKPVESPRLVPVVLRGDRSAPAPTAPRSEPASTPAAVVAIRLNLGNGISVSLEAAQAALAFAFTSLPLDIVHAHLCSANPLMARVLRRLGIKSDTGTLQTESRSRSEEVLRLSMSKATWTASLQDPAAH